MAGRKAKEAWGQTRNDWKPELLYGGVGGLLAIGILSASGWPESHLLSYGIPLVSVLGAALLIPFFQFLWKLAWQPWEGLKADVAAVKAKVETPSPSAPKDTEKEKVVNKRLTALNYVRAYDDMANTGYFKLRRSEAISEWTETVISFLSEHVSDEAVEQMLRADQSKRRDLLAEIAEELD